MAFALSYDDKMGRDSAIECVHERGTVNAFSSFTSIDPNFASPRDEVRRSEK